MLVWCVRGGRGVDGGGSGVGGVVGGGDGVSGGGCGVGVDVGDGDFVCRCWRWFWCW